jgi:hypothetical protein
MDLGFESNKNSKSVGTRHLLGLQMDQNFAPKIAIAFGEAQEF